MSKTVRMLDINSWPLADWVYCPMGDDSYSHASISSCKECEWFVAIAHLVGDKSRVICNYEEESMEKLDIQTHRDIVGLIEAEMGAVACGNYANSAERLACVIEGRLGHKTPKLPELTASQWAVIGPKFREAGLLIAKHYLEVRDAVEKQHPGAGLSTHIWGDDSKYEYLIEALREAGADI